jgi:hypothetical protein
VELVISYAPSITAVSQRPPKGPLGPSLSGFQRYQEFTGAELLERLYIRIQSA